VRAAPLMSATLVPPMPADCNEVRAQGGPGQGRQGQKSRRKRPHIVFLLVLFIVACEGNHRSSAGEVVVSRDLPLLRGALGGHATTLPFSVLHFYDFSGDSRQEIKAIALRFLHSPSCFSTLGAPDDFHLLRLALLRVSESFSRYYACLMAAPRESSELAPAQGRARQEEQVEHPERDERARRRQKNVVDEEKS